MSKKKKIKKSKRKSFKVISVRTHPRRVKVSQKNPDGITIVDPHSRRIKGTYLDEVEIESVVKNYDKENILYPAKNAMKFDDGNKYDDLIAVWTDYFNKKFKSEFDPDMVKALIASESGFRASDSSNKVAIGIIQITKPTLTILQDPKGEVKEFIFKNISQKDLENPNISIPMGVRWYTEKETSLSIRLVENQLMKRLF
jgi:hypothetical protein